MRVSMPTASILADCLLRAPRIVTQALGWVAIRWIHRYGRSDLRLFDLHLQ